MPVADGSPSRVAGVNSSLGEAEHVGALGVLGPGTNQMLYHRCSHVKAVLGGWHNTRLECRRLAEHQRS
jgi:hypothetical protein